MHPSSIVFLTSPPSPVSSAKESLRGWDTGRCCPFLRAHSRACQKSLGELGIDPSPRWSQHRVPSSNTSPPVGSRRESNPEPVHPMHGCCRSHHKTDCSQAESNRQLEGQSLPCCRYTMRTGKLLPGIEPGMQDSKSYVIADFTTEAGHRRESNAED